MVLNMAVDTKQVLNADDQARSLIRGLLAGVRPPIDPADCGQWADRAQELVDAFEQGGRASAF